VRTAAKASEMRLCECYIAQARPWLFIPSSITPIEWRVAVRPVTGSPTVTLTADAGCGHF